MTDSARPQPAARALDIAARSDVGRLRDGNEDSFVAVSAHGLALLAVCDGMGGAAGGEVASSTAAAVLRDALLASAEDGDPEDVEAVARRLVAGVEAASREVFTLAAARRSLLGMGTTATACALRGEHLYVAQVGDSRAYLLRRGALTQLTRDQTLATLLVERGQLAPEDVETFEHKNVILQAVGTHERVEVDLTHVTVGKGDVLLVCSDGLHGLVDPARLRDVLDGAPSAEAACQALVDAANEAGGPDNITCVVARLLDGSEPEGAATSAKPALRPRDSEPQDAGPSTPASTLDEDTAAREEGVFAKLTAMFRRRRAPTGA
jgi:protein phosphatase